MIKYFEVEDVDGTRKLIKDPAKFKYIRTNKLDDNKFEIAYDTDGFLDFKNTPEENFGAFLLNKKAYDAEVTDPIQYPSLKGAKFTLLDENDNVVKEVISDDNGLVSFEGILPGNYTLEESVAPQGYKRSDTVWRVNVLNNGNTYINKIGEETPEVTGGIDVTDQIRFNLEKSSITYDDHYNENHPDKIDKLAIDKDGKLQVESEENKISIKMDMFVQGTVNPGDYFVIKESDTLHYNMLQPDKTTYAKIFVNGTNKVLAKSTVRPGFNPNNGTNKDIYYVFTDEVKDLKDINMSVTWPSSVNKNVCKNNEICEFNVSIGNQVLKKSFEITYPEPNEIEPSNIISNYLYTNDYTGYYSQIGYINKLRRIFEGNTEIVIHTELKAGSFNMADLREGKSKVSLYKLKVGETLPKAVLFEKEKWEEVTNYKVRYITQGDDTGIVLNIGGIGKDTYLVKVDSLMRYPEKGVNGKYPLTFLGQTIQVQNSKNTYPVLWTNGISTNAGDGAGSGEGTYKPPSVDAINYPLNTKGKFIITKIEEREEKH